jgi:lipoprotein-anchoring transpeptidase ErfK/SrfK
MAVLFALAVRADGALRHRSPVARLTAVLVVLGALALSGCSTGGSSGSAADAAAASAVPAPVRSQLAAAAGVGNGAESTIIRANGASLNIYFSPVAKTPMSRLSNPNEAGAPRVLLVVNQVPGWYRVLLPVRPTGSHGWVKASDVTASKTAYHVTVARGAHTITVTNGKTPVLTAPVAIGTSDTPTPGGEYFVTELLAPRNPAGAYGPYAFGLSGFSTTLASFDGHDPVIGIHGTNQPAYLGRDVSHGCIRLSNANIRKLAAILPLGTPVSITA